MRDARETDEHDRGGDDASAVDEPLTLNQRRIRTSRLDLAHAALGILEERGWDAVSVVELADAAGVSPRTFHRYFPSKVDVVRPLLELAGGEARVEFLGNDETDFARLCAGAMVEGIATFPGGLPGAHRAYRLIMTHPELMPVWLDESYRIEQALLPHLTASLFQEHVHDGDASPIDDVELSVAVLFASMRIAVQTWIAGDDPHALLDLAVRAVNQSLRRGSV